MKKVRILWHFMHMNQSPENADVIVDNAQRMELYAKRDYQIPVEIPHEVRDAFAKLVRQRNVEQLIN